ncbi:MAG TPA: potassium channel family protein [Tepidisphaeraceae bacterium]|jgi:hypothetical protein|nr:potassium channel family protein [Tepidisphaeraceae bacterium]
MIRCLAGLIGVVLIFIVLVDAFESILQPRRVTRRYRLARLYYFSLWTCWRFIACSMGAGKRQVAFLSVFGPLSLLGMFATWVAVLIFGFGTVFWSIGGAIHAADMQPGFSTCLYLSGTTFFTLGYGDVTPRSAAGRVLAVSESGLGLGFFAAMLSYLPALFQAFSRRELSIALLDARAGSPPTAGQLLLRLARANNMAALDGFLAEWERWCADLLESQLSFPILGYYRSQHDNQSWLAALTTIMDTCAFLLVQVKGINSYQPQVTFAIARHAAVDLGLVLRTTVGQASADRLSTAQLADLRAQLANAGVALAEPVEAEQKLRELRGMYEPFVAALAERMILALPPFMVDTESPDNWQRSAWMRPAPGIGKLPRAGGNADHF